MACWNTGYGYRQSAWNALHLSTECGRCGLWYTREHQCMALSRKCLYCQRHGHYIKFCQKRLDAHWNSADVSSATPRQTKEARKQQKPKSTMKRKRDIRRYVSFTERKSVCVSMPFHDVSDSELPNLLPTSPCAKSVNNKFVTSKISDLQTEIGKQQMDIEHLKSQLTSAQSDISLIRSKNENYQSDLEDFKNKLSETCTQNSELQRTLINLRESLSDEQKCRRILEQKARSTEECLENIKKDIEGERRSHQHDLRELASLNNKMSGITHELATNTSSCTNLQKVLSTKLAEVHQLQRETTILTTKPLCHNCGKQKHKDATKCPAFWQTCGVCNNVGHFTSQHSAAVSNFECVVCDDTDYHHPFNCEGYRNLFPGGRRTMSSLLNSCRRCASEEHQHVHTNCPSHRIHCRHCRRKGHFVIQCEVLRNNIEGGCHC